MPALIFPNKALIFQLDTLFVEKPQFLGFFVK
jgi:hypothetical protein